MKHLSLGSAVMFGLLLGTNTLQASILPPNNLHLTPPVAGAGITHNEFDSILDDLEFLFIPLVWYHGGDLLVLRYWDNNTVNAYASRQGDDWVIQLFGGLARRPEITPEGFALVACHELGHHLGGYPFYNAVSWAASEGQADYFAAQLCLRALWLDDPQNEDFGDLIPAAARQGCDASWMTADDRGLCYRIAAASQSVANLFATLEQTSPPQFDQPDTSMASSTVVWHPPAQCRLDTYFRGARCTMDFDYDIIPGLNAPLGRTNIYAELEAAASSCFIASEWIGAEGYNHQDRPRCWFKPQLSN